MGCLGEIEVFDRRGAAFEFDAAVRFGEVGALADGRAASVEDVVLLDYVRVRANQGEDMSRCLEESARHLGKVNVLWGDMSVRPEGPTALDPLVEPEIWRP